MAFATHAAALQGLDSILMQKMNSDGLTYQDGFLLPFPQLLGIEEVQVTAELPGGNQTADENTKVKSALATVRWARLRLDQLATIQGSLHTLTGSTPNQVHRLKRRRSDVAPFFRMVGRVDYIGSEMPNGDYLFEAYKAKMVGTPKITHETDEKYATVEMQFKIFYRSDGEFYDLVMRETGAALVAAADVTPPTVSGITPADGATASLLTTPVVVTMSEACQLDPSNFSIQHVVSTSNISDVAFEATINGDKTQITLTKPGGWTASAVYNVRVAHVKDLAGNELETPVNIQFTAPAS